MKTESAPFEAVAETPLHHSLARALRRHRRPDGGFAFSPDGPSEVEPTVVATLALGDAAGRAWLQARQAGDGSFVELDGRSTQPSAGALAALALDGASARRALEYAVAQGGRLIPGDNGPHNHLGWGWASSPQDARTFVEPTARALLAVKARTPYDLRSRAAGVRMLERLQCADGGWNYGTVNVNSVDLRGYAQTTAMALLALQDEQASFARRGLHFLRRTWPDEPGGLTTAQALTVFRLFGLEADAQRAAGALAELGRRPSFASRPLTIAWAALATAPGSRLGRLRSRA